MNLIHTSKHGLVSMPGLLTTVLLTTCLADALFYRRAYGWAYGVFALLLGVLVLARPGPREARPAMRIAFLGLAAAAGAIVYRGGAMAPCLCAVFLFSMAGARVDRAMIHAHEWLLRLVSMPERVLLSVFRDRHRSRILRARTRNRTCRWVGALRRTLRNWIVPLVFGAIFLSLFCVANPLIQQSTENAAAFLRDLLAEVSLPPFARVLLWLLLAVTVWGLLRPLRNNPLQRVLEEMFPEVADSVLVLERKEEVVDGTSSPVPALAIRSLSLLNVLFLWQTVVDLLYLWGGRALPDGMSYASYAHRGAYPLLATALLSAALTLCFFAPGGQAERNRPARILSLVWLSQNILLTGSALWRLHLYVGVYSLTRLRLAACLWMALVAFGLVSIAVRILRRRDNIWLLDVNSVALVLTLLCCAWWPMEAFIAGHNVRHTLKEGSLVGDLDLVYLRELGPESIPALQLYVNRRGEPTGKAAMLAEQLQAELRRRLQDPMAWTWRRHGIAKADFHVRNPRQGVEP